jgi:ABC-type antimicrobial peptide transport system permease subunit
MAAWVAPQGHPGFAMTLYVEGRQKASMLLLELQHLIGSQYKVEGVSEQQRFINDTLIRERLLQRIAALFGTLSLVLAGLGLYAVMNYSILQRRQEIGVRIALGADPGRIVRSLMKDAGALVFLGTAAGILIAAIATRALKALLFGLTPTDPTAFLAAAFILVAVALLAAWIPSWRASVTDPMIALRRE